MRRTSGSSPAAHPSLSFLPLGKHIVTGEDYSPAIARPIGMAVTFAVEPHPLFEKTATCYNSECFQIASKASEIVEADNSKESDECNHFTIRGFVAEARKRDALNCWPFFRRDCAALETANAFPPLSVAKFRWWSCKNCVCEIIATEESECLQNNAIKEDSPKGSQNSQANCVPNGNGEKRGDCGTYVGRKKIRVSYRKGNLDTEANNSQKSNHTEMFNDSDATSIRLKFALGRHERRNLGKKTRKDCCNGQAKAEIAVGKVDVFSADSMQTPGAFIDENQEVENTPSKKLRKVRLLDDIIRSEKRHLSDVKFVQNGFIRRRISSKDESLLLNHTSNADYRNDASKSVGKSQSQHLVKIDNCVYQRNELRFSKRKNRHENRIKEANADGIEANPNYINGDVFFSKFSTDLSFGNYRCLDGRNNSIKVKSKIIDFRGTGIKETSSRTGVIANKMLLIERRKLRQSKDSFLAQNKPSLNVWKSAPKKPRNMGATDHEALDDIPMDIIQLLARNQHDRYHIIAENNKLNLPASSESIKYIRDFNLSQINRNAISHTDQWNISCPKFPCDGEMKYECACSINETKKLQIDLNQQCSDSLMNGVEPCYLNSNEFCHRPNLENQTISYEDVFIPPQHISSASHGTENQILHNFNTSWAHEKPRNLVARHNCWELSPTAPKSQPFSNIQNGHLSRFCAANLYNNETISASTLLRLMDQAACYGDHCLHYNELQYAPIPSRSSHRNINSSYLNPHNMILNSNSSFNLNTGFDCSAPNERFSVVRENCIINRNPADFTMFDDDNNEYSTDRCTKD